MKNLDQGPGFDSKQLLLFYFAITILALIYGTAKNNTSDRSTSIRMC